jgi:hypothetical protein
MHNSKFAAMAHAFSTHKKARLLADSAAADHRIHAMLLTTMRCPARFNLDRGFFAGGTVPGRCPQAEVQRSFVGRPSLCEGLRCLR